MSDTRMETPLGRVRGLGSAEAGAEHWWHERLTSVAAFLLFVWFIASLLRLPDLDHRTVALWLSSPLAAVPMILLIVLSATGGASAITAGLMLLTGAIDTADFDRDELTAHAADDWWWYVIYAVLVVAGLIVQLRAAAGLSASMRQSWETGRGGAPTPAPEP